MWKRGLFAFLSIVLVSFVSIVQVRAQGSPGGAPGVAKVSFGAPDNVWITGRGVATSFIAQRWNGESFSPPTGFPQGLPPVSVDSLTGAGVLALSQQEAWVVGRTGSSLLFYHYVRGRWSLAPSPAFTDNPALTAMSAEDSHDIWAAACEPTSAGVRQAFFLHWNGAGWRRVDIPRIVHRDICYTTIQAESHAQVVALGTSGNGNDLTDGRPVIAQLNGRTWDVQECLFMGGFTVGGAVIVNRKNIWAVRSDARGLQTVEHWTGHHWQLVPMFPSEGHTYNLKALDVARSTVWVVGTDGYNRVAKPLAMYWSGQKWTMTALPVIHTQMHYVLIAVKIFSSEDVESVEWDGYGEVFLDHWNGREWSISGQTPIYMSHPEPSSVDLDPL